MNAKHRLFAVCHHKPLLTKTAKAYGIALQAIAEARAHLGNNEPLRAGAVLRGFQEQYYDPELLRELEAKFEVPCETKKRRRDR